MQEGALTSFALYDASKMLAMQLLQ